MGHFPFWAFCTDYWNYTSIWDIVWSFCSTVPKSNLFLYYTHIPIFYEQSHGSRLLWTISRSNGHTHFPSPSDAPLINKQASSVPITREKKHRRKSWHMEWSAFDGAKVDWTKIYPEWSRTLDCIKDIFDLKHERPISVKVHGHMCNLTTCLID